MNFPVLYKRTKTGAIQSWEVRTMGGLIVKLAGQVGGKLTRHEETAVSKNVGKANETSETQQAQSQAKSDWQRKHDEGYKSLEDLGITTTFDETSPNAIKAGILLALDAKLPKFNTDASGNVKPMLAKAVNWDKITYPVFVQPKLDGVRCLLSVRHERKEGTEHGWTAFIDFLSRNGKPYETLDHIHADVFAASGTMDNFILDGEIYSDELSFQEIIAAVKKQRPDSIKLHFRAYDIVNEKEQRHRMADVVNLVALIGSPFIIAVPTHNATCKQDVLTLHDEFVKAGNEGAMIRIPSGKYGQGQRSSDLLKVKEFQDSEYLMIDFELGQRPEDLLAVCRDVNGDFRAKMEGNAKYKAELLEGWRSGKIRFPKLTIRHFGFTDSGLPRFPIGVIIRDYE